MKKLKIVTIGGGSGQFELLSGLRDVPYIDITTIVSMVDSGGSTGRLRDEFGILPPGDVLKCILALSPLKEAARTILLKRFEVDRRLKGHNAGNMLLTMLSRYTGSFPTGVSALAEILDVKGTILPVTIDKATLVAELTDGSRICGESAIDMPRGDQREKIQSVFLVPHHNETIHVYPPVIDAIENADFIIMGPGDLFTSVLPNLVVPGVTEAMCQTGATLLYVLNIMTKFGETHNFTGMDFVEKLEERLCRPVDGVLYNTRRPGGDILALYKKQKAEFVTIDPEDPRLGARKLHMAEMIDVAGGIVRHDALALAKCIESILRPPG